MPSSQKPAKLGSFEIMILTVSESQSSMKLRRMSRYSDPNLGKFHLSILFFTPVQPCSLTQLHHFDQEVFWLQRCGLFLLRPDDVLPTMSLESSLTQRQIMVHASMQDKKIEEYHV